MKRSYQSMLLAGAAALSLAACTVGTGEGGITRTGDRTTSSGGSPLGSGNTATGSSTVRPGTATGAPDTPGAYVDDKPPPATPQR